MNKEKVLCITCGCYVRYRFEESGEEVCYRDLNIAYMRKRAYCERCGEEVDVPGLWDENFSRIQKEYWRMRRGE